MLSVCVGYAIAIGLLATARHAFERTHLLHQAAPHPRPFSSEPEPELKRHLGLLGLVSFLFWIGFYAYGQWNKVNPAVPASGPLSGMDIVLQSISLDTVTTLFVLLLAPVFMIWEWFAASRRMKSYVTWRVICALGLIGFLFLRMLSKSTSAHLADYFLLTVAELLIVPISMSLAYALSPRGMQCSTLGAYYFLIGIAVWIPKLQANPSWGPVAVLAGGSAILMALVYRAGWDSLLDRIQLKNSAELSSESQKLTL